MRGPLNTKASRFPRYIHLLGNLSALDSRQRPRPVDRNSRSQRRTRISFVINSHTSRAPVSLRGPRQMPIRVNRKHVTNTRIVSNRNRTPVNRPNRINLYNNQIIRRSHLNSLSTSLTKSRHIISRRVISIQRRTKLDRLRKTRISTRHKNSIAPLPAPHVDLNRHHTSRPSACIRSRTKSLHSNGRLANTARQTIQLPPAGRYLCNLRKLVSGKGLQLMPSLRILVNPHVTRRLLNIGANLSLNPRI